MSGIPDTQISIKCLYVAMKKRQVKDNQQAFNQCLGSYLKELRIEKDIPQIDVAVAIGRQRTYLSELESGKHNPTVDTLRLLCDYYDIQLSGLFLAVETKL